MNYSLVIPLKLNTVKWSSYDFTYTPSRYRKYEDMYQIFISDNSHRHCIGYTHKKNNTFLISKGEYIYDTTNQEYVIIKHQDKLFLNSKLKNKRKRLFNIILNDNSNLEIEELENLDRFIINLNNIKFKSIRDRKQALEEFKNYIPNDGTNTEKKENEEDYIIQP